jgi:hypothetical protein
MEADHGDDSIDGQQRQAPSSQVGRPPPVVLTSWVKLIQLQMQLKSLLKVNFEFRSTRMGSELSRKKLWIFQPFALNLKAMTSHASPAIPNPRSL